MTAPAAQDAAQRPSLWRNRDFFALWSGQVLSTLGAQTSGTAMPLLVLATTGSPSDAGIVGAMRHASLPRRPPARRTAGGPMEPCGGSC